MFLLSSTAFIGSTHQHSFAIASKVINLEVNSNFSLLQAGSAATIGALKIQTGFWGPLYCNYIKEPPK